MYLAAFDGHQEIFLLGYNRESQFGNDRWIDDLKSLLSSKGAVETDVQIAEEDWWFGTYDNEDEKLYKNNQVAL